MVGARCSHAAVKTWHRMVFGTAIIISSRQTLDLKSHLQGDIHEIAYPLFPVKFNFTNG
jgi:hypothetical protein